jgi:subfamily B ATP-binding cassette protein MsbA
LGQVPSPGTLRRLVAYALGVWNLLVALGACVIGGALLDLAVPWIIGFLLLDRVIKQHDPSRLPSVVLLLTGVFVGQQIIDFVQNVVQELANQRLVNRVRCDLYEHALALPVRFYDKGRTGDLLSRVTGDIDTVEGFLETLIQDIGSEAVMLIGTLAFLFKINFTLTLALIPTVIALAACVFFFKKPIKIYSRRLRNFVGDLASLAGEAIGGIRVVKAFCAERFEFDRFRAKSMELLRGRVKEKTLSSIYGSSVELCVFAGTLIVVLFATPRVLSGALTIGGLVAYLSYLNKLYGPVKKLSKINLSIQKILAAADRVFEIMDVRPEAVNGFCPDRVAVSEQLASLEIPPYVAGAVVFDNVSFGYDVDHLVLKNFNLRVEPGEVVALVGPSGGGKTTIVNLLLRFYEPTSGRILIDGLSLDGYPLHHLRQQIGVVSQEPYLFSGTGRDNIAYAWPGTTEKRIIEAATAAHAHEFLSASPQGYSTEVGERGVQLSGGQRQRLAIARALLRSQRIIIFDEATSHLDSESEQLIQAALEKVMLGRTVFIIAHRLSTIRHAHKIVVIEDGEIVEAGRHEELLSRDGSYRKLYALQNAWPDSRVSSDGGGISNA